MSDRNRTLTELVRGLGLRFSHLRRAAGLVWAAAPGWSLAWGLLLLLQGLLPVATVYLSRLLVDSLVAAVNAEGAWERLQPVAILAALMAGLLLLGEFLQGAAEWVRAAQSEHLQDRVSALVHTKTVAVDLAFYDSPDYYDRLHRATNEAAGRPLALLESVGALLQNSLTLLGMAAILVPYGLWLPLVLLASTLPALYVALRFNRRFHFWRRQTTQDRRWVQYFHVMLTIKAAAAEVRLFGLGEQFQAAFQALRAKLRKERIDLSREQTLARLAAGALALLASAAALAWLGWRVLQGLLTLGDLALFYQAFSRGQNLLRAVLGNLGQIYADSLFLDDLFEFLELQPAVVDSPAPLPVPHDLRQGIRFRQVSFTYPGSRQPALKDFDLEVPAGQLAAIVGPNGAGKTTLVKLLCRFYDPDRGAIELDGIDLRRFSLASLRQRITVLFQEPVPYHATVAQNIALGDLRSPSDPTRIEAAARHAGAHPIVARLPRGYDTLLGRWFADGEELSAGEWQRIALARAYYRRAPIVVLDEPTSFMDSWAEAEWFARLRQLVSGRTTLIITHRFTIAMRADVIHVMHAGRIVESGTHEQLLAMGGSYAGSWAEQMQLISHAAA